MTQGLDPRSALRWLAEAGADETVSDAPQNRYAAKPAPAAPSSEKAPPQEQPLFASMTPGSSIETARAMAERCNTLEELRAALASFRGLAIVESATNLVFADGNPKAPIMFIGEAPGRDEDLQGKPFVGASGKLLDKILAAAGITRAENFTITNVIYWRPPGNREPTPEEMQTCRPFVERHIALQRPKILVALGAVPARQLWNTTEGITRLRGKWSVYRSGDLAIPAIATFHPANLLRQPLNKRYVWRDVLSIKAKLEELAA